MNNKKKKVADAALKLFQEKGIQQTSVQDIIDSANISKGTFYNYFATKNDCIAEILEDLRYEASQRRIALQVGKDTKDRDVFIDQISLLYTLQEASNLHRLFEAILHSNEKDLKKLVLQHRVYDMEWLTFRVIEVFGEDTRDYAFEGVVLFTGMLQHLLFVKRITNNVYDLKQLIDVTLSYLEMILQTMKSSGVSLLNYSAINQLRTHINKRIIKIEEIFEFAHQLQEQHQFDEDQQDLFDAILTELKADRIRKPVLLPLLKPFQTSLDKTEIELQAHTFTNLIWYYLQTK